MIRVKYRVGDTAETSTHENCDGWKVNNEGMLTVTASRSGGGAEPMAIYNAREWILAEDVGDGSTA